MTLHRTKRKLHLVRRHKPLKSGKICTADTEVLQLVTLPHDGIIKQNSKAADYYTLSIPLFVSGYIKVTDAEKPPLKALMGTHLAELIVDAELYGWSRPRLLWLQQREQGHASRSHGALKLTYC